MNKIIKKNTKFSHFIVFVSNLLTQQNQSLHIEFFHSQLILKNNDENF
jgi:hypothetical protein